MNIAQIQQSIFEWLRKNADLNEPLVHELAELYGVSQDSIYRRIRGEKLMTLEEILLLYATYDFSLEEVLSSSKARLVFSFQPISENAFDFIDYLEYINKMLERIAACKEKTLYYLANDVPLFQMLNTPTIASFKLFFWQKTILGFEQYKDLKFELGVKDERVNKISREIQEAYFKIPTVEIYSQQTIDTTLRQIEFYSRSGLFAEAKTALTLCDDFVDLIRHIKHQAEHGRKFRVSDQQVVYAEIDYQVYFNEVLYSDTTILVESDGEKMTYLTNNGLNVLRTDSIEYFDHSMNSFGLLQRKSIGVSGGNDRERERIFRLFEQQIIRFRDKLDMEIQAESIT